MNDVLSDLPDVAPPDRFGGIRRLYGLAASERLQQAQVTVIGIGGVGSWAAEALARSGVGKLTLVDLDEICVSNTNRQVHTEAGTVGRSKVEAMAERIHRINPACQVVPIFAFLTLDNVSDLLSPPLDFVIDAIDALGLE